MFVKVLTSPTSLTPPMSVSPPIRSQAHCALVDEVPAYWPMVIIC